MRSINTHTLTPRVLIRTALPAICSIWLVWVFSQNLTEIDLHEVRASVAVVNLGTWGMALICSWISFAAVSGYDPILGKILCTNIPIRRARSMSWKATAVSQLVGFGLVTGTLIRWVELGLNPNKPTENSITLAFKMTLAVSTSFLVAWAVITAAFAAYTFLSGFEFITLCLGFCIFGLVLRRLNLSAINRIKTHWTAYSKFLVLTVIDTVFAALVIYILLPPSIASFSTIYLAFLLSYVAGLVSGLPGGVGPFEICMIVLLPTIDPSLLAPALIGFRIVYFAVPAVFAVTFLGFERTRRQIKSPNATITNKLPSHLRRAAPPEMDLIHNNQLSCFISDANSEAALTLVTKNSIVQLGDAFGNRLSSSETTKQLRNRASWSKTSLCLYRCNRASALQAISLGMKATLFSSEAVLRPSEFDLKTSTRSGLRRKIRKAAKAGVTVNSKGYSLRDLSEINAAWVLRNGCARGFSTGTYSPELIKRQRIYVAYLDEQAVAFISVSVAKSSWQLDLIRYGDECPDGITFALITHAIEDARLLGIETFSLGSVPFSPPVQKNNFWGHIFRTAFNRSPSLKGLYQFKRAFDPEWHDRYFVANTLFDGIRAAFSVHAAINAPPLQTSPHNS